MLRGATYEFSATARRCIQPCRHCYAFTFRNSLEIVQNLLILVNAYEKHYKTIFLDCKRNNFLFKQGI